MNDLTGKSANDVTRSSLSNINSRINTDSSSTLMQGRRFTFSPMIGQVNSNQVIPEQQNECESSFKTGNTNKDIVQQYFEFLHKEVSSLLDFVLIAHIERKHQPCPVLVRERFGAGRNAAAGTEG